MNVGNRDTFEGKVMVQWVMSSNSQVFSPLLRRVGADTHAQHSVHGFLEFKEHEAAEHGGRGYVPAVFRLASE